MTASQANPASDERGVATTQLLGLMAVFVIIGAPMVFYIWRFVNDLLMGRIVASHALVALVLLIIFVFYMRIVARQVRRWETEAESST